MSNAIPVKGRLIQAIMLIAICLAIFFNTFANDFVWDDLSLIAENQYIRDFRNIPFFFTPHHWNEAHPFPGQYRPLRTVTFAIDYLFWKENPAGYHMTNLLLHTINVVLIFYLVSLITGRSPGRREETTAGRYVFLGLPFLTALFFATHPIHTETINFVKNRSDLLAFLFCLVSFLLFIKHFTGNGRMTKLFSLITAWICFIPAVMSKEIAIILPGVLALYAVRFLPGTDRKKALIRIVPYIGIGCVYFWFMHSFIKPVQSLSTGAQTLLPGDTGQHAMAVIKSMGCYFKMLVVPFPLSAEHAFEIPSSVLEPSVLLSLVVLLLILAGVVRSYQRSPVIFFAAGWILLTLLPVANIVYLVSRPIAEQRLYFPSFGFCLLLGYGAERLSHIRTKRLSPVRAVMLSGLLVGTITCLYAGITVRRNVDWRDPVTFFSGEVAANPYSARMHANLAHAYSVMGKIDYTLNHYSIALRLDPNYVEAHIDFGSFLSDINRPKEAASHYLAALRLNPDHPVAHNNLGNLFHKTGDLEKAINHFSSAVHFDPDNAMYHNHLGIALFDAGLTQDAVSHYLTALRIEPYNAGVHNSLGIALGDQGRFEDAIQHFRTAIELMPDNNQPFKNIGVALVGAGRVEDAISQMPAALRSNPDFAWVYDSIGRVYMQQGQYDRSLRYFNRALVLMPDNGVIYYNLGSVLAAAGNYREAAKFFAKAVRLVPDSVQAVQRYKQCLQMMDNDPTGQSDSEG